MDKTDDVIKAYTEVDDRDRIAFMTEAPWTVFVEPLEGTGVEPGPSTGDGRSVDLRIAVGVRYGKQAILLAFFSGSPVGQHFAHQMVEQHNALLRAPEDVVFPSRTEQDRRK